VRLAGTSIGRRGAVALEHGAGPPGGEPHQVHLAAAVCKPLMREGVPELVGMQAGEPD